MRPIVCRLFFAALFVIFAAPLDAMANGAVSRTGFAGSDLIVSATAPFEKFIVDEEVILDPGNNLVSVTYFINNAGATVKSFKMIFPVESIGGGNYCETIPAETEESFDKTVGFKVELNGAVLPVKEADIQQLRLEGEYKDLKSKACAFMTFNLDIKAGKNTLNVEYPLLSAWFQGDGIGESLHFHYSIWPAKNWVKKFRKALWRVVLPSDWKRFENMGKGYITGPGARKDYANRVDFTATNYVPEGTVSIEYDIRELISLVKEGCVGEDLSCLQSMLENSPYTGDKRCYIPDDLNLVPQYMDFGFDVKTMPFMRNEIYARKGYIFKDESIKRFFSGLSWYKPRYKDVRLSKVEKWNVAFIKKLEKEIAPEDGEGQDTDRLMRIYERMKKICPAQTPVRSSR